MGWVGGGLGWAGWGGWYVYVSERAATRLWLAAHRADPEKSGSFTRQGNGRRRSRQPFGRDRVVAPMALASTDLAFFLDVDDFAARRDLPIAADDAAAGESGETEKPNETH